jgi:hypothetical protein
MKNAKEGRELGYVPFPPRQEEEDIQCRKEDTWPYPSQLSKLLIFFRLY